MRSNCKATHPVIIDWFSKQALRCGLEMFHKGDHQKLHYGRLVEWPWKEL